MPANIAHMLICHKAVERVKNLLLDDKHAFIQSIDQTTPTDYRAYLNLGSMGPDLFYYSKSIKALHDIIFDKKIHATGVEPWSYHLHSIKPVDFVLNLIMIVFKDLKIDDGRRILEEEDVKKLAFITGFLSHMAADQIIHFVVNGIAGPYYREGENRFIHRESEIFQDYTLYRDIYETKRETDDKYNFDKQHFNDWADCIKGATFRNTEDWFLYFLQRGFVETFNTFPSEDIIEDSVDNLLGFLRLCNYPATKLFTQAKDAYGKLDNPSMQKYYQSIEYLKYYRIAVELSAVYLLAMLDVFKMLHQNKNYDEVVSLFNRVISKDDLATPVDQNILDKAVDNITQCINLTSIFKEGKQLIKKQQIVDLLDKKEIVNLK